MQMIADGKIKDGTKINRLDKYVSGRTYKNEYVYVNSTLKDYANDVNIFSIFDIKKIMEFDFEILEDKTEEIEEIQADDNYYIHTELGSFKGRKMDIAFVNKFNELTKIVNKLNKQDTSKETNCMTD